MTTPLLRVSRACVFKFSGRMFGIDIRSVAEVTLPRSVSDVPLAPPHLVGVMNLRGTLLPVVDAVQALGLGTTSKSGQLLVLRLGSGQIGVVVESVVGLRNVESLTSPGERARSEFGALADGHFETGDQQCLLLNAPAFLAALSIGARAA